MHKDWAEFLGILKLSVIFPLGFPKKFKRASEVLQENILKMESTRTMCCCSTSTWHLSELRLGTSGLKLCPGSAQTLSCLCTCLHPREKDATTYSMVNKQKMEPKKIITLCLRKSSNNHELLHLTDFLKWNYLYSNMCKSNDHFLFWSAQAVL